MLALLWVCISARWDIRASSLTLTCRSLELAFVLLPPSVAKEHRCLAASSADLADHAEHERPLEPPEPRPDVADVPLSAVPVHSDGVCGHRELVPEDAG